MTRLTPAISLPPSRKYSTSKSGLSSPLVSISQRTNVATLLQVGSRVGSTGSATLTAKPIAFVVFVARLSTMSARAFPCGARLLSTTVSPVASDITVHTPLVVMLGGVVFCGAELPVVEALGGAALLEGSVGSDVAGCPVVSVGGGIATFAGPDVAVVVARPAAGAGCRGLDWDDPPVEGAGIRVDGEEAVEGGAGVVAALWPAVAPEVAFDLRRLLKLPPARMPSDRALAASPGEAADGGAAFEAFAPALTVETRSLRCWIATTPTARSMATRHAKTRISC